MGSLLCMGGISLRSYGLVDMGFGTSVHLLTSTCGWKDF